MNAVSEWAKEVVQEFTPTKEPFKYSALALLKDEEQVIWNRRDNEPRYARLPDEDILASDRRPKLNAKQKAEALNVYDQPIDLLAHLRESENREVPEGQSLYINGNPAVGENPNRNKQHGFYFTADNCIGCHACESACAEKNETPSHLAFRSVGYVEGGSYPDFQRMNISMACNHCDDPVCLKGCPTGAYIKHTEYGAVLQDPDTCFGCGYCTWVCPYNAPQLDPVQGQVSKCNMCVDRLEVGLKPACVSACVGNALDFGVIDTVPENREQAKTAIPGFPDPEITHPNIRFQQKKRLPETMPRTDSAPIRYHLDKETGRYVPGLDPKHGHDKQWNMGKLNSRENPLVLFTILAQAAMGLFALGFIAKLTGIQAVSAGTGAAMVSSIAAVLGLVGLLFSTSHLGKPHRFYRGFNNLRHSPLSREAFGFALFLAFATMHAMLGWLSVTGWVSSLQTAVKVAMGVTAVLAITGGGFGLFYMIKCYRIPARPFWNHWQTGSSFIASVLVWGSVLLSVIALASGHGAIPTLCAVAFTLGVVLELAGLWAQANDHREANHEGAASHYVLTTTFGKTHLLRLALLVSAAVVAGITVMSLGLSGLALLTLTGAALLAMAAQLMGRALFYILVIPTTMPGAFFWRNKGFAEHAQDIGLNEVVDMGVVSAGH